MADLVVVGFGGAGAAAAIEAHDQGLDVLILEKSGQPGGSTKESGGTVRLLADPGHAAEHFLALTQGTTPRDVIETYIDGVTGLPAWLASLGAGQVSFSSAGFWHSVFPASYDGSAYPSVAGAAGLGSRLQFTVPEEPRRQNGEALFRVLERGVERRGIDAALGAEATALIQGESGRVEGVTFIEGGTRKSVRARAGVVLACGGFNYCAPMQVQWLGQALPALSPPGLATGDGIRMAQAAGADLWHMTAVAATFGFKAPTHEAAFWAQMTTPGFILVDSSGRRYLDEGSIEKHAAGLAMMTLDAVTGDYPRIPSYLIFDEATRLGGPVCATPTGFNRGMPWPADNSNAIEQRWVAVSDSIGGLAGEVGIPQGQVLEQEVAGYNRGAAAGRDRLGRSPSKMTPIATSPYYALEVRPCLLNTQGGPRRDASARIVGPSSSPIHGLYGAGELGSIWNRLYPGGGNVGEALVFGRLAARSAARYAA